MTFVDRMVSLITGIALLILSGGSVAFLLGWSGTTVVRWLENLVRAPFDAGVLSVLFFLWGLYFIMSFLRSESRSEKALLQETQFGQVRITLKAVESMVYRTASGVKGIRDVDARVLADDGISVNLSLGVAPDLSVPDLTSEVQERVKNSLLDTIGIESKTISVEVRSIEGGSRPRVE